MKRMIQTLTAMTVVAAAMTFGPAPAQAANPQVYREAMRDFSPVIVDWAAEAHNTLGAAVLKPELACEAATQELARRGHSIWADMAGTALAAPRAVRFSHDAATKALAGMVEQTAGACGHEQDAARAFDASFQTFAAPMKLIRLYAAR